MLQVVGGTAETEPVKDCDAAGQCCVLDHSLKIQTFNTLRSEMSGAAALQ